MRKLIWGKICIPGNQIAIKKNIWKENIWGRFSLNSTHLFSATLSFFPLDCHLAFFSLEKDEEQEKKRKEM